jgi:excisionase family DNA binding protein
MAGKPAPAKMSVTQAARFMKMTRQGIYQAIRRGSLPGKKVKDRWIVARADLEAWKRANKEAARPKNRRLTDEEFLQRLWDSDPD